MKLCCLSHKIGSASPSKRPILLPARIKDDRSGHRVLRPRPAGRPNPGERTSGPATGSSPGRPTGTARLSAPAQRTPADNRPGEPPARTGCGRHCPVSWRSASSRGSTRSHEPFSRRCSERFPSTASRSKARSGRSSHRVSGNRSSRASTVSALPAPAARDVDDRVPQPRQDRVQRGPQPRLPADGLPGRRARRVAARLGVRAGRRPRRGHAVHQRRSHLRLRRRDLRALDRGLHGGADPRRRHPRAPPETAARTAARRPAVRTADHAAQAATAQWALPAEVTVVALEPRADQHGLAAPDLHSDVLVDLEGGEPCLVTGDRRST